VSLTHLITRSPTRSRRRCGLLVGSSMLCCAHSITHSITRLPTRSRRRRSRSAGGAGEAAGAAAAAGGGGGADGDDDEGGPDDAGAGVSDEGWSIIHTPSTAFDVQYVPSICCA
jgi:hypothetical protein